MVLMSICDELHVPAVPGCCCVYWGVRAAAAPGAERVHLLSPPHPPGAGPLRTRGVELQSMLWFPKAAITDPVDRAKIASGIRGHKLERPKGWSKLPNWDIEIVKRHGYSDPETHGVYPLALFIIGMYYIWINGEKVWFAALADALGNHVGDEELPFYVGPR